MSVQDMISALDGELLPEDDYDHRTVAEVHGCGLISDSDVTTLYSWWRPRD